MFEPLLAADDKGNPLPMLATVVPTTQNGGISADGLTITYHLRKDAKWTDGVPVTSKDVKWSWQAIMNPDNNVVSRHGYDYVKSIDTPDDATVVVHLKTKFAPFVNTLLRRERPAVSGRAGARALQVSESSIRSRSTTHRRSATDPFASSSGRAAITSTLVRNDGFFMGKPKLDRIDIKIDSRREHVGKPSARRTPSTICSKPRPTRIRRCRAIPTSSSLASTSTATSRVQLNLARPLLDGSASCAKRSPMRSTRTQLTSTLTHGTHEGRDRRHPRLDVGVQPTVQLVSARPGEGRELLRGAGWAPGPDGIMRKNGEPLALALVSNNSNATRREAESFSSQAMLKQAGIGAEIKYYTGDMLFAPAGMGGILQLGKFDLSLAGWYAGIDPDDSSQYLVPERPARRLQLLALLQRRRWKRRRMRRSRITTAPTRTRGVLQDPGTPGARQSAHLLLVDAPDGADQRRLQRLRPQSGRRRLERVAMEHLGCARSERPGQSRNWSGCARSSSSARSRAATTCSRAACAATTTSTSSRLFADPQRACGASRGSSRRSSPNSTPTSSAAPNSAASSSRPRSRSSPASR